MHKMCQTDSPRPATILEVTVPAHWPGRNSGSLVLSVFLLSLL